MSLETMTKIGSYTVPSNTASFTMSNIPQGYTDLLIKVSSKTTYNNDYDLVYFTVNGDATAANYAYARLQGEGSTSTTTTGNGGVYIRTSGSSTAANNFYGNAEVTIFNYSGYNYKPFSVDSVEEINATGGVISLFDGMYYGVAPVTSITFYPNNASIAANTTVTLYGMKNAQRTAGNSIKATGGNIVFDGTYVYHVFPSTGAFVPTQPLTADILVVAGGGGGGHPTGGQAGGGGAGGLLTFSSQSLGVVSYTCTVGAGGAVASANNLPGSNGVSSQFGGLTACVGGGGGGSGNGPTGISGGSGGGGASVDSGTSTPGTGTVGQGNNGGTGNGAPNYAAGGGGGAGALGGSASSGNAGSGGIGFTSGFINGIGLATSSGQFSSGNYYFAGGGAGINGVSPTTTPTGGLGGGGASIVAGTAYTGGGGGGRASGGSGIIVVRYKG